MWLSGGAKIREQIQRIAFFVWVLFNAIISFRMPMMTNSSVHCSMLYPEYTYYNNVSSNRLSHMVILSVKIQRMFNTVSIVSLPNNGTNSRSNWTNKEYAFCVTTILNRIQFVLFSSSDIISLCVWMLIGSLGTFLKCPQTLGVKC